MSRVLGCCLIPGAVLALLISAATASSEVTTKTFDYGPVTVGGYQVKNDINVDIPKPTEAGSITKMQVDVYDPKTGRAVPINRIMLHHIVFANIGSKGEKREPFYGAGEERAEMDLPPGYGYKVESSDRWAIVWMLMNHKAETDTVNIRYTLTYDTSADIKPVKPLPLDVSGGRQGLVFDVPGGGAPGSTYSKIGYRTVPYSGRLLAGLGHVHGGAKDLALSQPTCGDRKIYDSKPTWGLASDPFYNVKPVLHEPGPIGMSRFKTPTGLPVVKGEQLKLTANYDGERPHTRVMGLMVVYIAQDDSVTDSCAALPGDVETLRTSKAGRDVAPIFRVPLTGLNPAGTAVTIQRPPGAMSVSGNKFFSSTVGRLSFKQPNISVPQGTTVRWKFATSTLHNVTIADGPIGFSSDRLRDGKTFSEKLTKPGTYKILCELHPVDMTQRIIVRPKTK